LVPTGADQAITEMENVRMISEVFIEYAAVAGAADVDRASI